MAQETIGAGTAPYDPTDFVTRQHFDKCDNNFDELYSGAHLAANVQAFLTDPTSAKLAAAVTDETGTGALVFAVSPSFTTPALGTPSALVLTNATGLPFGGLAASAYDTDGTLAANSDTTLPTQRAVKTYVDTAVTGLLDFKGSTDCSTSPDFPAASKGDAYVVSVAGKIGGASGLDVEVGDVFVAAADNAGGTLAAVGASWFTLEHNLQGALLTGGSLGTPSGGNLSNCSDLPLTTGVTGVLPLANGGTGAALVDPDADRLLFWDDSAGALTFLDLGGGLAIDGTTLKKVHRGAMVTLSANPGDADRTTAAAISWNSEVYDTDSIWDGGNPTRLTVPAGVSMVKVGGHVRLFNGSAAGILNFYPTKSGDAVPLPDIYSVPGATGAGGEFLTGPIPVTPGDYFELFLRWLSDTSTNIQASTTAFWLEILE